MKNFKLYIKRFFRRLKYCFIWNKFKLRIQQQSCDRCGQFQWIDFVIKDNLWEKIIKDKYNKVCLNCFLEISNNKNIIIDLKFLKKLFFLNEVKDNNLKMDYIFPITILDKENE